MADVTLVALILDFHFILHGLNIFFFFNFLWNIFACACMLFLYILFMLSACLSIGGFSFFPFHHFIMWTWLAFTFNKTKLFGLN